MSHSNVGKSAIVRASRLSGALALAATGVLCLTVSCSSGGGVEPEGSAAVTRSELGTPPGAQACVVGTSSLRIAQSVTVAGGVAADSFSVESNTTINGGANINNVAGATVRISGPATVINGAFSIAGAAPSQANGELINGAVINGPVTTGAGSQSALPTVTVTPGTTNVTRNVNSPPLTLAPGNYANVTLQGSTTTFTAGTYNLASLTIHAGSTVVFNTSGGAIAINVQGAIAVTGGALSAGNAALVTLYSNSSSANAVVVNSGVGTLPATVTAPLGGVTIGPNLAVNGCVGGKNVNFEPNTRINGTAAATGCADGSREGFTNLNANPNIAGCSGGWSIPGVMATNPGVAPACGNVVTHNTVTPACGRMGGDDGLNPNGNGCNVADLCAAGWHVCTTSADITAHSPSVCGNATTPTDPPLFFVSRQSSNGCGVCATGTRTDADCNASACTQGCAQTAVTSNDIFGCGNFGATSPIVDCGPITRFGNDQCGGLGGSNWSCNDADGGFCEAYVVTHAGPQFGGALCCRD